jgi:Fe2+ transport system protein B
MYATQLEVYFIYNSLCMLFSLYNVKQKSNRVKKESELQYELSQCFLSSYINVPQEQFLMVEALVYTACLMSIISLCQEHGWRSTSYTTA